MGLKYLIFLLFMVTHTVYAYYPDGLLDFARNPPKVTFDSVEDMLAADLVKTDLLSRDFPGEWRTSKKQSEMKTSESRTDSGSWSDFDDLASSSFEDPYENDALHSRKSANSNKREEYYEGLEKKSYRETYIPPPRKNFYTTPESTDSSSASVEERYDRSRSRANDHSDDYADRDSDVMHAESHPFMNALMHMVPPPHLPLPSHPMFRHAQPPVQIPPWRYVEGKSYPKPVAPRRPMPPPTTTVPPTPVTEKPKAPEPSPDPLQTKAAVHSHHRSSYKVVPKRPFASSMPKARFNDHSTFKTIPKSKPWASDFKKKETITPKFSSAFEDKSFGSSPGFGKPVRQQFHEQGTRGPHSYKFGYSTGDKDNPMARYEERGADGVVRGSYSYIDPRGQKQVVHYESHPKLGFKTDASPGF